MKRNKVKNKIKMNSTKVNGNERIDIYNALRKVIDDICEDEIVKITLEFLYDEIKGIRNNFDFTGTPITLQFKNRGSKDEDDE